MTKQYQPKYWNHKGKYQKTYNALYAAGVPNEGKANTEWGEIIRVISKLYYDIYNNGGDNFGVYTQERAWLVSAMPSSLKEAARKFTAPIKYSMLKSNNDYMRFLDLFVDASVTHADYLKTLSEIEL